ncbi:MAG: enoyl-CoA hydratase/isomerase family protein [Pseudomonadales bacterium]|nr:enoyl-CoA hydratase/isomerase family protein [Pseudomonadales bacterium]
MKRFGDVELQTLGHVTVVEMQRPPYNFFDAALIGSVADAFESLDQDVDCRAVVLAAQGRAFSAGADFKAESNRNLFAGDPDRGAAELYRHAVRLFRTRKPIVAAIQGPAIGGGLGLALVADFRVACEHSCFSANFVHLGVHAGFGISHTLPRIIGNQAASLMLYTGHRIGPEEALDMGLADVLTTEELLREEAISLAADIAAAAPLAVESTRETLRSGLADAVEQQLQRELAEQQRLAATLDHAEGVRAVTERRPGKFTRG